METVFALKQMFPKSHEHFVLSVKARTFHTANFAIDAAIGHSTFDTHSSIAALSAWRPGLSIDTTVITAIESERRS